MGRWTGRVIDGCWSDIGPRICGGVRVRVVRWRGVKVWECCEGVGEGEDVGGEVELKVGYVEVVGQGRMTTADGVWVRGYGVDENETLCPWGKW